MACVAVKVRGTGTIEKWPLSVFIDEDGEFTDSDVCEMVNDWCATAETWPTHNRQCLFCRRRARRANTLCGHCQPAWQDAIYATD